MLHHDQTSPAAPGLDARDSLILARLRSIDGPVPGQALADELGISRVALWKRIERLKGLSYHVEGSHAGYRLAGEDAITHGEFGADAGVRCLTHTGSTMDEAAAWADSGALSGNLVIADRQDSGRGQHGRAWTSPAGGLYLTLIIRPRLPMSYAGSLLLETGAWVSAWLEERCRAQVRLQWPNDLMVGERKIGGILVETTGSPDNPRWFNLGLGINFHALDDLSAGRPVIGIDQLGPRSLRRRELAMAFRDHLRGWSDRPDLRPAFWATRAQGLGARVRIEERPELADAASTPEPSGMTTACRAVGFNRQGGLILQGGRQPWVLPGEVQKVNYPA